jgi:AcrR family transcriptional regulator
MLDPEEGIFEMVQLLLLAMFILMDDDDDDFFEALLSVILLEELDMEELRENRERPRNRRRSTWATYSGCFSDRIFRRMFRMSRNSFDELCRLIETCVGEEVFKSESYLANRAGTATDAARNAVGGFLSGEMKVAMTIRLLAGGVVPRHLGVIRHG